MDRWTDKQIDRQTDRQTDIYMGKYTCPNKPTLFLSEFELSGSSAANMAEDIMMQTRTMLPKYGWLQMKWQNTRNLQKEQFLTF